MLKAMKEVYMRLRDVAFGVAFAISLFSCSGSSNTGHSPARPLTQQEIGRLKETVLSFADVTSLASAYTSKSGQKPGQKSGPTPHALFDKLNDVVSGSESPLKKVIDEFDCQKSIQYPDEQPPLKAGDNSVPVFSIDVSGPGCPVLYHADVHGTQLPDGLNAVIAFKYQAISEEALKANDVDASDVSGVFTVKQTQTPDGSSNLSFAMDLGGKGHSQIEGDFAMADKLSGFMDVKIPQSQGGGGFPTISINGTIDEGTTFTFRDMTGEMTSSTSIIGFQQKAEYKINGQVVTEQEYKELHDAMKLPGLQPKDDNQTPNSAVLSCTSRIYPSSASPVALQAELDQGRLPVMPALSEFHSCSDFKGNDQHVDRFGAGEMKSSFDYTNPAFAKAEVTYSEAGASSQTTQRYYLPNETKGYADSVGSYTVVTFCESKPACF